MANTKLIMAGKLVWNGGIDSLVVYRSKATALSGILPGKPPSQLQISSSQPISVASCKWCMGMVANRCLISLTLLVDHAEFV